MTFTVLDASESFARIAELSRRVVDPFSRMSVALQRICYSIRIMRLGAPGGSIGSVAYQSGYKHSSIALHLATIINVEIKNCWP